MAALCFILKGCSSFLHSALGIERNLQQMSAAYLDRIISCEFVLHWFIQPCPVLISESSLPCLLLDVNVGITLHYNVSCRSSFPRTSSVPM